MGGFIDGASLIQAMKIANERKYKKLKKKIKSEKSTWKIILSKFSKIIR